MPRSTQVPPDIVMKWQEIVDLLAELMHVPSALVMQVEPPSIKVFVSSESKGNPYEANETAPLNTGLYCETVIKNRRPLLVPDALQDEEWKSNPDIKLGMISYLGVPISWPDGAVFGTICVLDSKRNAYSALFLRLLLQCRDVLQADLKTLTTVSSQLEEREAKIRRLVEANIIGIMFWQIDGGIVEANEAFLRIVGYEREDLVSGRMRWTDMTPPELREDDARALAEAMSTGTAQPYEKEYIRKDGSRVPVMIGAAMIEAEGNEGIAFVLDLTERKRAEEDLRKMQAELAHANRVTTMGQLAASITHEVKQPISANVLQAQAGLHWLSAQPPNLEEARRSFEHVIEDAKRASEVVNRIRGLAKNVPPCKEKLQINDAIREVVALTQGELVNSGVSMQTRLTEDLPLVEGDRVQLQQVILNLIINAIEALSAVEDGPRELDIGTTRDEAGSILITVRDSGPGVAFENKAHLFEPFYTTKQGGMGMGLSICRSIVAAHGGHLTVSANEPRGAVFQFTVPVHDDERTSVMI